MIVFKIIAMVWLATDSTHIFVIISLEYTCKTFSLYASNTKTKRDFVKIDSSKNKESQIK
jgi:hypothetical protein